jgi:7-cyano-7-deazaguanine reductase
VCSEFTSLCPVTGHPDYGRLQIDYVPARLCVESKSLKLYLMQYRNEGAFHEDCVNRVANDLFARISPKYLTVYGDFNPRGGIAIRPFAVRRAAGLTEGEEARCLALIAQTATHAHPAPDEQLATCPPRTTQPPRPPALQRLPPLHNCTPDDVAYP